MEYKNLAHTQRPFYNKENVHDLFETTDPKNIINFLKKIDSQSRMFFNNPPLQKDTHIYS